MLRLTLAVLCLSGCAVMHRVTGDPVFRPEQAPAARAPVVPEPEPSDVLQYHLDLDDSDLTALPPPPPKKKDPRVASTTNPKSE